jgi:hypothetical protein
VSKLELVDSREFAYEFLVPQRLASLSATLKGKVYNQVNDVNSELVAAPFSLNCNQIARTSQIADFYLQPTPSGYLLSLRGRNGEPIAKKPVHIEVKLKQFSEVQHFQLATNPLGQIALGKLVDAVWIQAQTDACQPMKFELNDLARSWPAQLNVGANSPIHLALGSDHESLGNFQLTELRNDLPVRSWHENMLIEGSLLIIRELPAGDFRLQDHRLGHSVVLRVADSPSRDYAGVGRYSVGKNRILQNDRFEQVSIRTAQLVDDKLRIQVAGADTATRLHVAALPYLPSSRWSGFFDVTRAPAYTQGRAPLRALYQDSLKIDEEYRYILDRQGIKI